MGENVNGLKNLQIIVQDRTVGRGTITVIYKMFCNGRPVCVVYSFNKVILLLYFCGYMLFNFRIQTLIGSPDVL